MNIHIPFDILTEGFIDEMHNTQENIVGENCAALILDGLSEQFSKDDDFLDFIIFNLEDGGKEFIKKMAKKIEANPNGVDPYA